MIRSTCEWESSPFQFRLYPGSLSYIKKGLVAPVLMVEVARDNVSAGIDFFCSSFDGENPLSPCGIPYLFITLYHNQLSDQEHQQIIEDTIHHIGQVSLVHLHGITDIDALVTLWQNITTKLRNVLLSLPAHKSTNRLFLQVEKESELGSLVCAFHSVNSELVMPNLAHLSSYLRQCIVDEDFEKVFIYQDFSLTATMKSIPIKRGGIQITSKPIPLEIQEHTSLALSKLVQKTPKQSTSSSVCSFSPTIATTSSYSNSTTLSSTSSVPVRPLPTSTILSPSSQTIPSTLAAEQRFRAIEAKLDFSTTRMDSIEDLCCQLKTSTDCISGQLNQLMADIPTSNSVGKDAWQRAPKTAKLS